MYKFDEKIIVKINKYSDFIVGHYEVAFVKYNELIKYKVALELPSDYKNYSAINLVNSSPK